MKKKWFSVSAIAGLSFLSCNTHATGADEAIIVTATRTAQTADASLASVSVITREDIERRQAQSVADLLQGEPGLSISTNGGAGKASSLFLRGTESDHVLVLVDGVKVGSATLGTVGFEHIPLTQIERIEIVRGPRSSLYGSEAIGGVIQIFTRQGGGATTPYFSAMSGSNRTYEGVLGVSGGGHNGWFNASLGGYGTEGFNACNGVMDVAGCFTREPDKDGYRRRSGSLRAGYRFENGAQLDAFWTRTRGRTHYDQADGFDPITFLGIENGPNYAEIVQETIGASVKLRPAPVWQLSLLAGQGRDQSDNFRSGGVFDSRFNTRRDTISFQNDLTISGNHIVTLGSDYQNDQVGSTTAYTVSARDNKAVFSQYQGTFGPFNAQAALRRDNNEQFGHHNTGSGALGFRPDKDLNFFVSHGTAFKAPTFNELYYPFFGNPSLQPETSRSTEVGMRGLLDGTRWSLAAFQTEVGQLIAYDASTSAVANVATARLRGVEATVATKLMGWDSRSALTLLDPKNQTPGAYQGNDLPRRAHESFRFEADRALGNPFRVGATLRGEGRRYDDLANTRELKPYAVADLRGEYLVTRDWRLQARVENLFNKDYETAAYYNQPGRGLTLTVRYEPRRS